MAAPTNAANVKKVLANSEPSTHGGKADIVRMLRNVLDPKRHPQLKLAAVQPRF
jgi:hypothetical protein